MPKIVAYIRTSTDKQDLNNQKLEILEYARQKDIRIDEFIEITISSRKTSRQRRIDEMVEKLEDLDTLVVTELSRIGRSTAEVIALVNALITRKVRVVVLKQGLDLYQHDMNSKVMITLFSLFAELERDFISIRTKEALAAKRLQGVRLGKPKGTVQKSKFDKDLDRIKDLLALGLSVRKIAKLLGYTNHVGINTYVKRRKIRQLAAS
jgi:DNA invertase Pin-like site-specific DNA recombinase